MNLVNLVLVLAAFILGGMNAYQALTGRRLSSRPSKRSDEKMRRQSTIAAVLLIGLAVGFLALLTIT